MTEFTPEQIAALEKQGVLPDLRATIRASIFCSLHEQEAKEMVAPPPEGLKRLRETEHAPLTTALVREFLKKTGMERTLSVFDHEISTGAAHADGHDNALLLPHSSLLHHVALLLEIKYLSSDRGVVEGGEGRHSRRPRPNTCRRHHTGRSRGRGHVKSRVQGSVVDRNLPWEEGCRTLQVCRQVM